MASAEIPEPLPELPTPAVEVEVSFEQRDGLGLSTKRNQTVDLPQDGVVVPESERHLDRQCSLEVARSHLAAVEDHVQGQKVRQREGSEWRNVDGLQRPESTALRCEPFIRRSQERDAIVRRCLPDLPNARVERVERGSASCSKTQRNEQGRKNDGAGHDGQANDEQLPATRLSGG